MRLRQQQLEDDARRQANAPQKKPADQVQSNQTSSSSHY